MRGLLPVAVSALVIMVQTIRRNRLLPWYIGIVIAAEIYVGYQMFYVGCPAPVLLELAMLKDLPE